MEKQTTQFVTSTNSTGSQLPTTDHERVLDTLENEFKKMDKMFVNGEMKVFGKIF